MADTKTSARKPSQVAQETHDALTALVAAVGGRPTSTLDPEVRSIATTLCSIGRGLGCEPRRYAELAPTPDGIVDGWRAVVSLGRELDRLAARGSEEAAFAEQLAAYDRGHSDRIEKACAAALLRLKNRQR